MLPGQQASVSDVSTEEDKFKRNDDDVRADKLSQAMHFFGKSFECKDVAVIYATPV